MAHDEHVFEKDFWGDCINTFDEEQKHYIYAQNMMLKLEYSSFILDKPSKIIDIGGGPVSMMLKTKDIVDGSVVIDPLADDYPQWVHDRYKTKGIKALSMSGEDIDTLEDTFDEAWMYNVLQHTEDPVKILKNMQKLPSGSEYLNGLIFHPMMDTHTCSRKKCLMKRLVFMELLRKTVVVVVTDDHGRALLIVFEKKLVI